MQINDTLFKTNDIQYFMNPYHYTKCSLSAISREKVIALSEDNKSFAVSTFNNRYENWYDIETCKGHGSNWSDSIFTNKAEVVVETYQKEFNKAVEDLNAEDLKEIAILERKIEEIKNKKTTKWNFIKKQEEELNHIKQTLKVS